jgi:predicted amidophosphoribosyltransferase
MYCPKCQSQNEENAQFCRNCGTNLHTPQVETKEDNTSSTLLFMYIAIMAISVLAQFEIQNLVDNWYEGVWKYVQGTLWLIQNLIFILIPLSIKNKALKIIGIVIAAILIIYWGYSNVEFMTRGY